MQAFTTTDMGGQYVTDPSQTLGGPWICPTPPQYSDGECDPCGKNTSIPNPYWGEWILHPKTESRRYDVKPQPFKHVLSHKVHPFPDAIKYPMSVPAV